MTNKPFCKNYFFAKIDSIKKAGFLSEGLVLGTVVGLVEVQGSGKRGTRDLRRFMLTPACRRANSVGGIGSPEHVSG